MGNSRANEYILIKEYPGSPKLRSIAQFIVGENRVYRYKVNKDLEPTWYIRNCEDYPEFWEPIRYYKLISQTNDNNWLENDGNVMKIGRVIASFEICNGEPMSYWIDGQERYWEEVDKPKDFIINNIPRVPMFTTQDGVNLYEGDKVYSVPYYFSISEKIVGKYDGYNENHPVPHWYSDDKYFSSKEKAREYIIMNKPCLSIKEVAPIFGMHYLNNSKDTLEKVSKALSAIVESKILKL